MMLGKQNKHGSTKQRRKTSWWSGLVPPLVTIMCRQTMYKEEQGVQTGAEKHAAHLLICTQSVQGRSSRVGQVPYGQGQATGQLLAGLCQLGCTIVPHHHHLGLPLHACDASHVLMHTLH